MPTTKDENEKEDDRTQNLLFIGHTLASKDDCLKPHGTLNSKTTTNYITRHLFLAFALLHSKLNKTLITTNEAQ